MRLSTRLAVSFVLIAFGFGCSSHSAVTPIPSTASTDVSQNVVFAGKGVWAQMASMPTARDSLAAGVANGILFAVGGFAPIGRALNVVEAYDPITNTWTTKAPMPTSRFFLAVGVINNTLYAVGGANEAKGVLSTVEAYDPATDTWTTKAPLPTPLYLLGAGVVNDKLYAIGG